MYSVQIIELVCKSLGGIINENDLCEYLQKHPNSKAAIDVFENEPYNGKLLELDNAFLTPHLGSCTEKSRLDMEIGAAQEVMNFIHHREFFNRIV